MEDFNHYITKLYHIQVIPHENIIPALHGGLHLVQGASLETPEVATIKASFWAENNTVIRMLTSKELMERVETVSLLDTTPEFPESPVSHRLLGICDSLGIFCGASCCCCCIMGEPCTSVHVMVTGSRGGLLTTKPGSVAMLRWMSRVCGIWSILMLYLLSSLGGLARKVDVLVGRMT